MAKASANADLVDRFDSFYRNYCEGEIGELAQRYPNEQRSLYVDYDDLYRFDVDLAEDYRTQPEQMREYAEEALRQFDLPADVKLGRAHVRLTNLPDSVDIRDIRVHDDHIGRLVKMRGIVRKATDVRPKVVEAAFECQRCGTMTYIPQRDGSFQEPHECQGCERQGPFRVNHDQSEFVDSQQIRVQESPEGLRGGETPQHIDVNLEDDVTGMVTAGDHVSITGVLHIEQMEQGSGKSAVFDLYMDGVAVEIEDEEFEDMAITPEDVEEILALSQEPEVHELMIDSIAPTIYGYREEKFAMVLQLFSGVTKHLPDRSRIRGDMHLLLIGDPGTGKCTKSDTLVTLADGTEREIGELVESRLDDPIPVDDGVYQPADFQVQSVDVNGQIVTRQATRVWKREAPDRMLRIRTESGRELEVTPSHPLFVQDGLGVEPRTADELDTGTFLALPRRLRGEEDDSLGVDHRNAGNGPANRLDAPDELTPGLGRLLGYLIGEGDASGPGPGTSVVVTSADDTVLADVSDCFDSLGLHWWRCPHSGRDGVELVGCSSVELVDFLEQIEPAILERSAEQRVPDCLFRAGPATKHAFLRSYVEGEAHVSTNERELTVASMSRGLLEGVRSLLLSFGIHGSIRPRQNGSFGLRISGTDFVTYVDKIGFVTDRKQQAAAASEDTPQNTNTDVVPNLATDLRRVREALALSQFECGVPRPAYQQYERGDRTPSRSTLRRVVETFETRLEWFRDAKSRVETGDREDVVALREELCLSQARLAEGMDVTQTAVSYDERNDAAPDGGAAGATEVVTDRIDRALAVESDVAALRELVESDLRWDRIESIETVDPDDDWVYDLEVADTHTYVSNGVVSHNSQLLSYIRKVAPRSVYTSGKGSSAAGLCVTGDTLVHTTDGFRPIRDLAEPHHPNPVDDDEAAPAHHDVYTFDRTDGTVETRSSSRVWRMPEKPCRRIETAHGKRVEASVNTPVLVRGEGGMAWRDVSEVDPGDHVAVPSYDDVERSSPSPREFFVFGAERLKPTDESVELLRDRLCAEFGTLRDAAAALDLPEEFVYDTLSTRYLPRERLDRVLDATGLDVDDIDVDRAMLRHGDPVSIPDEFDEDLLYLVGLVFGDGDISVSRRGENRGYVRISNSDERLLREAVDIVDETFDRSVEIERQDDRVPCVRLNSATVARFFENLGTETPKDDLALDPRLTTADGADAFLRGLFDADGSVCARDDGGSSVQFSTTSDELGRQVQLMLETYGVRARRRERDRRGTYERADGHEIESRSVQTRLAIYGEDLDRFAARVGFRSAAKTDALSRIAGDTPRRGERLPLGDALVRADGAGQPGDFHTNLVRGDDPCRERARAVLDDRDLGGATTLVEEVAEADLVWDEVVATDDLGEREVFDLTVPETHNFVADGVVTHNTAAAVRDDFGDGQQWTLEAGALVLADKGIAAVDELDKMNPDDRSAMHQALEQQEISVSKAGINATLKSRCSLLGAANPRYGRFDPYEPIAEQIDLEPALVSRFDLIFTVQDKPDPEKDADLADHILNANYAGELATQRERMTNPEFDDAEIEAVTEDVEPAVDPALMRKYIAYARRECFPSMTEAARERIKEFYVEMREKGTDEDAPVPITARKLEALVRLAEATARVRLSDEVTEADATRVVELVRSCLENIGVDPETGEFDADVVETGTSKSQRDRIKSVKALIEDVEGDYDGGAPFEEVLDRADEVGMDRAKVEREIENLKQKGEVYEPSLDSLRTT